MMKKVSLGIVVVLLVMVNLSKAEQPLLKTAKVLKIQKEANDRPNHKAWHELTQKYVAASGKVNYEGMKTELDRLKTYLTHLKNNPTQKT